MLGMELPLPSFYCSLSALLSCAAVAVGFHRQVFSVHDWSRNLRIRIAARLLCQGGVIAYPTEAVWGLGCDPLNRLAFQEILDLKQRPLAKGVILIASDIEQIRPYVGNMDDQCWQRIEKPGSRPTTWVVPAGPLAPSWITGNRQSLAVRITRHGVAAGLCRAFGGALVSTSANPGGLPPARNALKVRCYFGDRLAAIAPGNVGAANRPSEIRDIQTGQILRPGG